MPLQNWTTPPGRITLANIQTEFGGSNPISLGEYFAGSTYVAGGTTGNLGGVLTSIPVYATPRNTIRMGNFFEASAAGTTTTTSTTTTSTTTTTAGPGTTTTTSTTSTTTTTTTSSGSVSLSAMDAGNFTHTVTTPNASNVYLRFFSNGTWNVRDIDGTILATGNWYTPTSTGIGSSYWINWISTSNTVSGGASIAADSAGFVTLADSGNVLVPSQTIYAETPGSALAVGQSVYFIRIASDAGGTTIVANANVTLQAETTSGI